MLALVFFVLIFSSILWFVFSARFVFNALDGISLFDAGLTDILLYMILICLPIFLIWTIFGYVNQYLNNKNVNLQLRKLAGQMKKNQDYSDLLARVLIEHKQNINDSFALNRFDLLIADMNELLSEIIKYSKLASAEQIESLWTKVQNGGKWSFGKVIIENHNNQNNFQKRLYEQASYNHMLGGTIMEFCSRYETVVQMLENHDQEKIFLNIIEIGVMGKVFSILSPISAEIQRGRIVTDSFVQPTKLQSSSIYAPEANYEGSNKSSNDKNQNNIQHNDKTKFFDKINIFKKNKPAMPKQPSQERDPFSIALERSFGEQEAREITNLQNPENEKQNFDEISISATEDIDSPIAPQTDNFDYKETFKESESDSESGYEPEYKIEPKLTDTQKTLDNLRKEWNNSTQEASMVVKPKEKTVAQKDENTLAYPFGSWSDEKNYNQ